MTTEKNATNTSSAKGRTAGEATIAAPVKKGVS